MASLVPTFHRELRPLTLNLSVIIFRGLRGHCQRVAVEDVCAQTLISDIKKKVETALGRPATELEVFIGGKAARDLSKLADYNTEQWSKMQILVSYDDTPRISEAMACEHEGESPPSTTYKSASDDLPTSVSSMTFCDFELLQSEWLPGPRAERKLQLPPPVLMSRATGSRSSRLIGPGREVDNEKSDLQERKFRLHIHGRIFLGNRGHQRATALTVSASSRVSELKEMVIEWLGAKPDELILLGNGIELEDHCTLSAYRIGPMLTVGALAWYEHICEQDLHAARLAEFTTAEASASGAQ
mmetsp:Transcript_10165/g.32247  ORF Transcript_10165/g.32247 Transcript_10165/m.32247 type:complete len:300 (-) Transcript_10165:116-1015(-)